MDKCFRFLNISVAFANTRYMYMAKMPKLHKKKKKNTGLIRGRVRYSLGPSKYPNRQMWLCMTISAHYLHVWNAVIQRLPFRNNRALTSFRTKGLKIVDKKSNKLYSRPSGSLRFESDG